MVNKSILGAGLGAFIHNELLTNNRPLVIHNSFLWLLSEFGLFGSIAFIMFPLRTCIYSSKSIVLHVKKIKLLTAQDGVLFCILVNFLMMAMVHDILYQRIFWFLLGICLVKQNNDGSTLVSPQRNQEVAKPAVLAS